MDDVGSPDASGPSIRDGIFPSEESPAVLSGIDEDEDDAGSSRSLVRTPSRKQKNLFMETQARLRKESTSDPNLKVRAVTGRATRAVWRVRARGLCRRRALRAGLSRARAPRRST